MRQYIFLDDVRNSKEVYVGTDWVTVRTPAEFRNYFDTHKPTDFIVSFDYDLGEGENGYDLLRWLLENYNPTDVRFHSTDWETVKSMRAYWKNWRQINEEAS